MKEGVVGKILVFAFFVVAVQIGWSQTSYNIDVNQSSLKVSGTSTLHDWHMDAQKYSCNVLAEIVDEKVIIESIDFVCNSKSILSDNSLMDDKTHKALQVNKWTEIKFNLVEHDIAILMDKQSKSAIIGVLEICGVKRSVDLNYSAIFDSHNAISVNGKVSIAMSDFNIKAPTALMGTVKTGDVITISFDFKFIEAQ